ncbi:RNA-binding protein CP33, chloroplastic-like isoform X2 [Chenopodium quinoa]|uniref:RNA-binding protein CP33, chloroplastic-like isoform X2 n=1 Tax=Chenopodium quinoa TaxID=63459 RepID=UPI000B76F5BD|nr:RNA-binding protein CP33, chloroplastic-like isoform X2 [Chenopodium quinoa]
MKVGLSMEARVATTSILFSHLHTSLPSPTLSKLPFLSKSSSPSQFHLRISNSTLSSPLKFPLYPSNTPFTRPNFELQSAVEALEEIPNETQDNNVQKRKLYVVNLPFSLSSDDLKKVFSECGTVKDVELIRNKDGKNRGYAFVTMDSGDEAQVVIDKFHSKELFGRTIRVEFAKSLKKPRPQPPAVQPVKETVYKLYVSNLQWKVRSTDLKEFFSSDFTPVSTRVVFESTPFLRSAGYGFVSFNTREDAEAALTSLDGKNFM